MIPAKGEIVVVVAGMQREARRNGRDQLAHHAPVEVYGLDPYVCPGALPVFQRNRIAEHDPDLLEDTHGSFIDPDHLFFAQWLGQRQAALERRQHLRVTLLADSLAGATTAALGSYGFDIHPTLSPSAGSVRSIQMVLSWVYWSWAWMPLSRPPKPDWLKPPKGVEISPSP